jgi:hypothetical protein
MTSLRLGNSPCRTRTRTVTSWCKVSCCGDRITAGLPLVWIREDCAPTDSGSRVKEQQSEV